MTTKTSKSNTLNNAINLNLFMTENAIKSINNSFYNQINNPIENLNYSFNQQINNPIENLCYCFNTSILEKIQNTIGIVNQIDFSNMKQFNPDIDVSDIIDSLNKINDSIEAPEFSLEESIISDNQSNSIVNNNISTYNGKKLTLPEFINLIYIIFSIISMLSQHFDTDKIEREKLFLDVLNKINNKLSISIENND